MLIEKLLMQYGGKNVFIFYVFAGNLVRGGGVRLFRIFCQKLQIQNGGFNMKAKIVKW